MKHKAKFLMPGSFMPEEITRELPERTIDAAVAAAPEGAYCFEFYDVAVPDFDYDTERFTVLPKAQNRSARIYLGGEVFTCDQLRALASKEGKPDRYDILISNVTHWQDGGFVEGRAIRCAPGNWQPYNGEEIVDLATVGGPGWTIGRKYGLIDS